MFKNLIILILTSILLHMTNPSDSEFKKYYGEKIEKMQEKVGLIDKVILGTKELNAKLNVKGEDKFFYSIYTVNYMGQEEEYIGIGTKFVNAEKAREQAKGVKEGMLVILDNLKKKLGDA